MGRTTEKLPAAIRLGERIRAQRARLQVTQEALAERCGLHVTYVASVERGERNVSLINILKLAQALESDPGILLRGLKP